jgi:hypothetical protein
MVLSFNSIFGGNVIEHNFVSKSLILNSFQKVENHFLYIYFMKHNINICYI